MKNVFDFILQHFLSKIFVVFIIFITLHRPSGSFRAGGSNLNGFLRKSTLCSLPKGGLGWVFQREKGRLRTLSSTLKPGKFECQWRYRNRSVRVGDLYPIFLYGVYMSRRGPTGCLSSDKAISRARAWDKRVQATHVFLYPSHLTNTNAESGWL